MTQYEANLSMRALSPGREERRFIDWLSQTSVTVVVRLMAWRERARSRRHLGGLNGHLLRDIGIDCATAQVEADKPFWQG